jgi:hypothetical protein
MPEGPAIGALWDERARRYTAISRVFEVKPRRTVEVPFEQASRGAHLVVQLGRHALARTLDEAGAEVVLARKTGTLAPDVTVSTANLLYLVWYDLAPGPAELRGSSRHSVLEPLRVRLGEAGIERLQGAFKPRHPIDLARRD